MCASCGHMGLIAPNEQTLHEALSEIGVTSAKEDRDDSLGTRSLYCDGVFLGQFSAYHAWRLVHEAKRHDADSLAVLFANLADNAA